ncbi:MAG: helix-turn-helix domain-containing protein [Chloroflexota bacterium]
MTELGDLLRTAREDKKLTVDEVSRSTRIKPQYLEALEHGDYGQIPGPAYITGFLRNYALAIGLHPDDAVQEYHSLRPTQTPTVRPATRVLASGHNREHRRRILWSLATLLLFLGGGFAVKQYSDTYAHQYSAPNITPPNLGVAQPPVQLPHTAPSVVHVTLRPVSPVWVWVTVDRIPKFHGVLRPGSARTRWVAHSSIYVVTMHGARVMVSVNGRRMGPMSRHAGLTVDVATPTGWQRVA